MPTLDGQHFGYDKEGLKEYKKALGKKTLKNLQDATIKKVKKQNKKKGRDDSPPSRSFNEGRKIIGWRMSNPPQPIYEKKHKPLL